MPVDVSVAAVLEHYGATVAVPETGWRALRCPFHDDRQASASVNLELNGFRCHACQMAGDGIKLIEIKEGLAFAEAVEFARAILGQSVGCVLPATRERKKPRRSSWDRTLFD